MSCASAFSLLELVLVLGIMATAAAIAAPRYGSALARYHADLAARRIAADLELARATARNRSGEQRVVFDASNNSYTLPDLNPSDDSIYEVDLTQPPYEATLQAVTLDGGGDTLTFNGYGVPVSGGGTIRVSVGNIVRRIIIEPTTGRASVP